MKRAHHSIRIITIVVASVMTLTLFGCGQSTITGIDQDTSLQSQETVPPVDYDPDGWW